MNSPHFDSDDRNELEQAEEYLSQLLDQRRRVDDDPGAQELARRGPQFRALVDAYHLLGESQQLLPRPAARPQLADEAIRGLGRPLAPAWRRPGVAARTVAATAAIGLLLAAGNYLTPQPRVEEAAHSPAHQRPTTANQASQLSLVESKRLPRISRQHLRKINPHLRRAIAARVGESPPQIAATPEAAPPTLMAEPSPALTLLPMVRVALSVPSGESPPTPSPTAAPAPESGMPDLQPVGRSAAKVLDFLLEVLPVEAQ